MKIKEKELMKKEIVQRQFDCILKKFDKLGHNPELMKEKINKFLEEHKGMLRPEQEALLRIGLEILDKGLDFGY